ncbi:ParB/RepB/Spo0J family partition protein [Konateibacter massiliensis]|uniref:ParB/RepB/Spo0J family partition protein n=1 Tax=Konateibacter massiliensis TaxID=2002841 RepID=UPI000C14AD40|nr:ParB/RepB/Spo0J family partition protein [Konateibacter massiliensis]
MAVRAKGLGKGLDSLIPDSGIKEENAKIIEKVIEKPVEKKIKITKIEPNLNQPRKNFEEDALLELADSIKQFGIIQPLVVQERENFYEIIAGERRWRAAKLAGLKEVPVIIKQYTEEEVLEIALIENIQRESLNPIEEAIAYQKLIQQFNLKQDEIAERVSKSRTAVTNSLRLLKLDERVQQMVIDDKISTGHARTLITIEDKELQYHLANRIFDEKLSVRETEKLIKKLMSDKEEEKKKKVEIKNDFIYKNIEDKITSIVGTKVTINQKSNNKGRIEIEYYSNDELERIFDLLQTIDN